MLMTQNTLDVSDLDKAHEHYLERLAVLQVRKFVSLGMAHRKYASKGRVITTVLIPPSYRSTVGEDNYSLQAALPEDQI
jgi:hypothetical protein